MPSRIPKVMPQHVRRERPDMDQKHIDKIKLCLCVGCGRSAGNGYVIDPHHLMRVTATSRGTSMKNADRWAVPLCRSLFDSTGCHSQIDKNTNDDEWFAAQGKDSRAIASALWAVREEGVSEYERVVFRTLQSARLNGAA